MKGKWVLGIVIGALAAYPAIGAAAEHAGKEHAGKEQAGALEAKEHAGVTQEHAGKEHGGITQSKEHAGQPQEQADQVAQGLEPQPEQIRQAIRDSISQIEQEEGAFTIDDEVMGSARTLTLVRVHDRVGKTGGFYYSCTDMQDASTGELLDLDFDVELKDGELDVVDVRIHKLNGQPRYTYDENDNRIPVM